MATEFTEKSADSAVATMVPHATASQVVRLDKLSLAAVHHTVASLQHLKWEQQVTAWQMAATSHLCTLLLLQRATRWARGAAALCLQVNHVPTMTGGIGTEALREFYHNHFITKMPDDVKLTPIDRTVAKDTVVGVGRAGLV